MRIAGILLVAFLLSLGALGCESATTIPAGAQQVRVGVTPGSVQLSPSAVHRGDVYLVLDLPPQGVRLAFVQRAAGGGLSDADLTQLRQNEDAPGLSEEALDVSCCGNVVKKSLEPGKYALVVENAAAVQPGSPPLAVAVLDVGP